MTEIVFDKKELLTKLVCFQDIHKDIGMKVMIDKVLLGNCAINNTILCQGEISVKPTGFVEEELIYFQLYPIIKILKAMKDKEVILNIVDDSFITLTNNNSRHQLPLYDTGNNYEGFLRDMSKLQLNTKVLFEDVKEVEGLIKLVDYVGESLVFETKDKVIEISSGEGNQQAKAIKSLEIEPIPSKTKMGGDLVKKTIQKLEGQVTLYFDIRKPLRVEYNDNNLFYIIAPRVDND